MREADADMAALSPETCDYLRELARKLDATPHGGGTALVSDAAEFLGMSTQTVYRHLKTVAGRSSGRKARCDKGSTSVSTDALVALGAVQREAVRENGKQTLFTTTARAMLEQNGYAFGGLSNARLNKLMADRKLDVGAQRVAAPVQSLRAPYPNHTHQVDPSLCLVYYLKGRQYIIRDDEFYKNKLDKIAQVKFKVYRYVCYDRASASIIPWYCEAAGEDQHNLFRFLMFAWGQHEGRLMHGVPSILLWDKGSANQASAIQSLLEALGVTHLTHEAGNARAKGGVENANNLVETQFESRLRFQPVDDVDQLNAAAFAWANAYNANLIPGQDTRLKRAGLVAPVSRYDLWQLITAEQLRVLPPVEVCQAFMRSKEEERKVRPDQSISFSHPTVGRSLPYSLKGLDGISVGDMVTVRALVYGDNAIQVQVPRYDGEPLLYRVEPAVNFDRFGQDADAAEVGAEYKSTTATMAERAAQDMDAAAYPGMNAAEVKKARSKRETPFEGKLNSHGYLQEVEMPTYLQRTGSDIETPAHAGTGGPEMLDAVTAMLRIVAATGHSLEPEQYEFFMRRYAGGVPEDQIDTVIAEFRTPAQQPMRAAGGLRAV